jgi:gliding motility-associated-like protein
MVVKAADNLDSIPVIVNTASATDGTSTKPTSGCDPASPDCTGGTGTSISTILGDAALVFANAMSPNGDGKNEYFIIKGLEKYPPASLFVFSRWGNMVYQSSAYNNNWDGAGLSEGTYYYKLVIAGADGKKTFTGWILLKRK